MNNSIQSKFRIQYWIQSILVIIALAGIITFLIYNCFDNGSFDTANAFFGMALLIFLFLIGSILQFLYSEVKSLIITDKSITIKYLMSSPIQIKYDQICDISSKQEYSRSGIAGLTRITYIFTIFLQDGEEISFYDNQYKNFDECKYWINFYFTKGLRSEGALNDSGHN